MSLLKIRKLIKPGWPILPGHLFWELFFSISLSPNPTCPAHLITHSSASLLVLFGVAWHQQCAPALENLSNTYFLTGILEGKDVSDFKLL